MNPKRIEELVRKNRSYRRFYEDFTVSKDQLIQFIDCARLAPCAANLQPLKYYLSCDSTTNEKIFPFLKWAGYLKDWPGPQPGERPSAYIIIVADTKIGKPDVDHGFAAQTILLAAAEAGLGGCVIANIQKSSVKKACGIADHLDILLILALGKPKEKVVLEDVAADGSIRYWRDEEGVHHVPKRSLNDILVN